MINHTYFYFNIISSTYVHNNAPVFESRTDGQHSREPLVNFTQVVPSHNKHDMFWRWLIGDAFVHKQSLR